MADFSLAVFSLVFMAISVVTCVGEHREIEGNHLCNCHVSSPQQDQNSSLVYQLISTLLERAVTKIEQLSVQQQTTMSHLEAKIDRVCGQQTIAPTSPQRVCPEDFSYDDNSNLCIKPIEGRIGQWNEAKEYCESSVTGGGRLAVLDSQHKVRFALQTVSGHSWWVGGRLQDDQWSWLNGEEIREDEISDSSGEGSGAQHCLRLRPSRRRLTKSRCAISSYFICELPMV